MIIVSNTSPLCYLVLIGHADVLVKLYGEIHVTRKVLEELRHPDAPPSVRQWATTPPAWLKIHSDPEEPDQTLATLDPGERTALRLAELLRSDVVLLDEAAARSLAGQRGGKYFLISSDCSGWAPNTARVSVAENIFGPWEELGNPCFGTNEQTANTFNSQSTFILPVPGRADAFIFMADRWNPKNAIDGRYVWLPIEFRHGAPMISWHDEWDLGFFNKANG